MTAEHLPTAAAGECPVEIADIGGWPGATELFVPFARGVMATTRVGDELRRLVRREMRALLGIGVDLSVELPSVVPARIAERADYLSAFPHLLGVVRSFAGARRDHLPLLRAVQDGGDWGGLLDSTGFVLAPAACHGLYDLLADSSVDGLRAEVSARCFRNEASREATRFQCFEMVEFVCVGGHDDVMAFAAEGLDEAAAVLDHLGLDVTAEPAHDPFFGAAAAMLVASAAGDGRQDGARGRGAGRVVRGRVGQPSRAPLRRGVLHRRRGAAGEQRLRRLRDRTAAPRRGRVRVKRQSCPARQGSGQHGGELRCEEAVR